MVKEILEELNYDPYAATQLPKWVRKERNIPPHEVVQITKLVYKILQERNYHHLPIPIVQSKIPEPNTSSSHQMLLDPAETQLGAMAFETPGELPSTYMTAHDSLQVEDTLNKASDCLPPLVVKLRTDSTTTSTNNQFPGRGRPRVRGQSDSRSSFTRNRRQSSFHGSHYARFPQQRNRETRFGSGHGPFGKQRSRRFWRLPGYSNHAPHKSRAQSEPQQQNSAVPPFLTQLTYYRGYSNPHSRGNKYRRLHGRTFNRGNRSKQNFPPRPPNRSTGSLQFGASVLTPHSSVRFNIQSQRFTSQASGHISPQFLIRHGVVLFLQRDEMKNEEYQSEELDDPGGFILPSSQI